MISVEEARGLILEQVKSLPSECIALAGALGRTLAEPVVAARAQPPFAASAMDGYALRSADTPGKLHVVGESAAGRAYASAVKPGEAVRIFTGAPIPDGADAIAIQEDVQRTANVIETPATHAGQHIRAAGLDFAEGARLLEPGRALDAIALALAATTGRTKISVVQRPRIAILSGGDEIVAAGATFGASQIYDSASPGVAGLVATWGAIASTAPPLPDDALAIARAAENALAASDLLVIIGGASVGDHDFARAALDRIGAKLIFSRVSIRPGRPTWFAVRNGKPILGLAGNPASALVCARLFLRPAIEHMLGRDPALCVTTSAARLKHALEGNGPREHYLRAASQTDSSGQLWVDGYADQDSSLLSVFAAANCLVQRIANAPPAATGDIVQILDF